MSTIWMVSAEFGRYTEHFVNGGYAAVGWLDKEDLTSVHSRAEIFQRFREAHPDQTPNQAGANAGQLAKFILSIQPGDYIMTRCAPPTREYRYGIVEGEPLYYSDTTDGCPFPHRCKVKWSEQPIIKADRSIPFQKSLSAAKTLFEVRHMEEFLVAIGEKPVVKRSPYDTYRVVLDQILEKITPAEFEDLVSALMEAIGYEDVDRTGGTGDEGVDVKGMLQSSFVSVDMYVQVKHYKNRAVPRSDVKKLHGAIPTGGQGAIITTSDFAKKAIDAADDPNFPHVSLINGGRLVDLLREYWNEEPLASRPEPDVPSWHERLGLTQGLVIL